MAEFWLFSGPSLLTPPPVLTLYLPISVIDIYPFPQPRKVAPQTCPRWKSHGGRLEWANEEHVVRITLSLAKKK